MLELAILGSQLHYKRDTEINSILCTLVKEILMPK
jgi:hypothetical protein